MLLYRLLQNHHHYLIQSLLPPVAVVVHQMLGQIVLPFYKAHQNGMEKERLAERLVEIVQLKILLEIHQLNNKIGVNKVNNT